MTRFPILIITVALAGLFASCATGVEEGWDTGTHDTGTGDAVDTGLDTMPPDAPWDTVPPDSPMDTTPTDGTDTAVDTGGEDVGGDPGTCTVADFVTQTMCSPGYKCTIGSVDELGNPDPVCDVAGTAGWNEPCTATGTHDDCAAGYLCVGSTTSSTCKRYCSSDTTCRTSPGGPNGGCLITLVAGTTEIVGVTICSIHCEPLDVYSSGCNTDQACRSATTESGIWFTDCREYGTGTACMAATADDCPRGEGCFNTGGTTYECLSYCRYPTGTPGCVSGTCTPITDWPTWIGVCL